MSQTKVNYQNGLIYTMRERGTQNIFYVGSTTCLRKRRNKHKYSSKTDNRRIYTYIRSIGGWECIIIEELHKFPCNNKQELCLEEGRVQKEYIAKGYILECGNIAGRTTKEYKQDNKEYYSNYMKKYSEDNKEKLKEYKSNYYNNNKERLNERNKERVLCDCGTEVRRNGIPRHIRTIKHQKWVESQN